MEMDGVAYHLITPSEYQAMLQDTGFPNIQMEDVSSRNSQFFPGQYPQDKGISAQHSKRNTVEMCMRYSD